MKKSNKTKSSPPASFTKLAMKNMVRNGRQSLVHLAFTAIGFFSFVLLLAWFARPNLPL